MGFKWTPNFLSADPLFAIQAFNAGGELSCLDNIRINIKPNGFPLLPSLLTLRPRQVSFRGRWEKCLRQC